MPKLLYESNTLVYFRLLVEYLEPIYILFFLNLRSFANCSSAKDCGKRTWVHFHMNSYYYLLAVCYYRENMLEEDYNNDDDFD